MSRCVIANLSTVKGIYVLLEFLWNYIYFAFFLRHTKQSGSASLWLQIKIVDLWEWLGNFIPHYWTCDCLSMPGLKLNHVIKKGSLWYLKNIPSPKPNKMRTSCIFVKKHVNTLRSREICPHFADNFFACILFNTNVRISLKMSLEIVPVLRINNITALV